MPTKRTSHRPLANVPRDPENPDQTFTVKPPDRGNVVEASYGPDAETPSVPFMPNPVPDGLIAREGEYVRAELAKRGAVPPTTITTPLEDPKVDLPYQRSTRQLTDDTANIVRHTEAAKTVALVSDRSSRFGDKHVRAIELYASARNDLRDLKLAEHDVVRRREEAVAICCERLIGKDNLQREPMKDGSRYKHSKESATAYAYEKDPSVIELQLERDRLTLAIMYADAAVDIAARAADSSALLLARDTAAMQATTGSTLARSIDRLTQQLTDISSEGVTLLRS